MSSSLQQSQLLGLAIVAGFGALLYYKTAPGVFDTRELPQGPHYFEYGFPTRRGIKVPIGEARSQQVYVGQQSRAYTSQARDLYGHDHLLSLR